MRPYSSPFLSFLAYGGSLRSVSSHRTWGPPQISFLTYYEGLDPYAFFSYYMEAPRIISLHTILGPPDHFLRLLYGAPQISFFSYNMVAHLTSVSLFTIWPSPPPPLRSVSLHAIGGPPQILVFSQNIWGPPLRSVSPLTIWGPLRSVSVHTFWAPLRSVFSLTIWGPLRSVSSPTIWGSPEIGFFAYYIRAPSDQFLRLLYEGPIRSVSLHTI